MQLAPTKKRSWVLGVGSLGMCYLTLNDPRSFGFLVAYVIVGYLGSLLLSKKNNLTVAVLTTFVLIYMAYKKYFFLEFIPGGEGLLAHSLNSLGVSFIIFRQISWALHQPSGHLMHYLAYMFNFTTFVAGPVQEPHDFMEQIDKPVAKQSNNELLRHLSRITTGLVKKFILCDLLFLHSLPVTFDLSALSGFEWLVACNVWFVYLYLDFSGYCDIVLGIAGLMGLPLPENFNHPFKARNLIDFWSRWHITLSEWIKNYIHIPLTRLLTDKFGVERLRFNSIVAVFVAFFLIGLWHGNTLSFVVFGLTQGFGVAVCNFLEVGIKNKWGKKSFKAYKANPVVKYLAIFITLEYMALCLSLMKYTPTDVGHMTLKIFGVSV